MLSKTLDKFKISVGQRVKELRESKELSKTQFADLLGKERKDVIEIEKGERNLTLKTLLQLAEVLDVEVITFFDFNNKLGTHYKTASEPKKATPRKKIAKKVKK